MIDGKSSIFRVWIATDYTQAILHGVHLLIIVLGNTIVTFESLIAIIEFHALWILLASSL